MKEFLKIGALLGGAFLLWQVMTKQSKAATTPATSATPAGTSTEATPTTTVGLLQAAAAKFNLPAMMTADQWGWVYAHIRGTPAPDPLGYLGTRERSFLFSAEQWFNEALVPVGMSGLSRRAWGI